MDTDRMKVKVIIEADGEKEEIAVSYKYLDQIAKETHCLFIGEPKKDLSMDYAEALSNKFKHVTQSLLERVLRKREETQIDK